MANYDHLSHSYTKLNDIEKSIVDIVVLIFEPLSVYELQAFYFPKVSFLGQNKFNGAISNLKKYGFLPEFDGYHLRFPLAFIVKHFPQACNQPESKKYIQSIKEKFFDMDSHHFYKTKIAQRIVRNVLFDYFLVDENLLDKSLVALKKCEDQELSPIFSEMVSFSEYDNLLIRLSPPLLMRIVYDALSTNMMLLKDNTRIEALLKKIKEQVVLPSMVKSRLDTFKAEIALFHAHFQSPLVLNQKSDLGLEAWIHSLALMYQGDAQEANDIFMIGLTNYRKLSGQSKYIPENCFSLFYLLHLLVYNPGEHAEVLHKFKSILVKSKFIDEKILLPLTYLAGSQRYEAQKALDVIYRDQIYSLTPLNRVVYILSVFLVEEKLDASFLAIAQELFQMARDHGHILIAYELAYVIYFCDAAADKGQWSQNIPNFELKIKPLISRIQRKSDWEQSLDNLLGIGINKNKPGKAAKVEDANRLVYWVDFDHQLVRPMLQTFSAKGWSRGRNIALKRLKERQIDGMTEQDNRIASAIRHEKSYYGSEYYIDFQKMLPELAGHPYLFYADNPDISIELEKGQPELFTEKTTKGYLLKTDISETEQKIILTKETNTRYKLIQLTEEQLSVIRALNKGRLLVPEAGKNQLLKAMSHLSAFMTIHSDLTGVDKSLKQIEADSRIRVQLLPIGDSLKAEWFVKPFGNVPPYSKPGKGGKTLYGTLGDEKCMVVRNLDAEMQNANALSNQLTPITDFDLDDGPALFENPEDCLALLESLQQNSDIALVEWPEGERFKIRRSVTFNQLSLSVKGKGHWFEMSGELKIDEETVLSLKQLLALTSKSKNRFVEMGNGEFLALTEELKKRLNELALFSAIDKTGIKLNKFAAPALDGLSELAGSFKTDKAWKDFQKNLESNKAIVHQIPSNLKADLRPYQEEGFFWMARLADWDAGACLADDMGLGKTLQALAILLHRAEKGPALIVAPASVVANWVSEASRFAPTLNIRLLRNNDRIEVLESLTPFDILITTYGLLQSEEVQMGKINWATVVLDEAHIIKNNQTKTSKAAMGIQAGFRLILTGTPIQNHLGELWNLFNFINPGLLGTLQQFNERFVNPTLKYGGVAEKTYLKKLIAPFILRRTKANVLDELPPKTEITQLVELSDEEMAFYEALRRQAIEAIESSEGPTGQQHLRALAEITKLRLACCHPSLVNDSINLPSSKLKAFADIVSELLENKHRALVFSQFIGHLAIVREMLDEQNVSYQYLDGSTPLEKRASIVKDFQSGNGDLFLISLKAGGLGLNLTAADYVIHLDPWWNPAIEDQASDRAHRIGQNRPVTVYRLVAQDTIEEKIIQLHHTKRDMADSLLEGSDQSGKLNTNDLLNLLRGI